MDEKSKEEYIVTSQNYYSSPHRRVGVASFSLKKKINNISSLQKSYGLYCPMPCFSTTIIIQEDKNDFIDPIINNIEPIEKNIDKYNKEESNNKNKSPEKSEKNVYNINNKKKVNNENNFNNNKDNLKNTCINSNDINKFEFLYKDKNDEKKNLTKKSIHKNKSEFTTIKKNESKIIITRSRTLRGNKKKAKKKEKLRKY